MHLDDDEHTMNGPVGRVIPRHHEENTPMHPVLEALIVTAIVAGGMLITYAASVFVPGIWG